MIRASDSCLTGGRGVPNAISPASDGENWNEQSGSYTPAFTGSEITFTGASSSNIWTLGAQTFIGIDVLCHVDTLTNDTIGVVARFLNTSNYYRGDYNPASGTLTITLHHNGSDNVLTSLNVGTPTTSGWNLHLSAQTVSTNNLLLSWWDDSSTDPGWILIATDLTIRTAGAVGIYGNAGASGHILAYDSFVAQDPVPFNPPAPPSHVPDSPYGNTIYVKTATATYLPQQAITDLLGIAPGAWERPQYQWKLIEPNADQDYQWNYLDWAVTLCNSYGVNILWPIQAPPNNYLTIRATDGAAVPYPGQVQSTLTAPITAGTPTPTISVSAINGNLTTGEAYTVDVKPNQENILIVGNYSAGATSLTVSNLSGGTWIPGNNHGSGAYAGTTGGQFASASAWATFVTAVCARYNGTVNSPYSGYPMLLNGLQLGNEDYDLAVLGVPSSQPQRDILSQWLVPVVNACYPIIRAALPKARILLNAVRHTPNNGLLHVVNWNTNLYTYAGGLLAAWRADENTEHDLHYYRDGTLNYDGTPIADPTQNTYVSANGPINCPSIAVELAAIQAVIAASGSKSRVSCTEFGWNLTWASTDKYVSDSQVFTPAQVAQYEQAVIDAMRLGGGSHVCVYTCYPAAKEGSKTLPLSPTNPSTQVVTTSTEQKSLTQFIGGVYTDTLPYTTMRNFAGTYPSWPGVLPGRTLISAGRTGGITAAGDVQPLTTHGRAGHVQAAGASGLIETTGCAGAISAVEEG